MYIVLNYYRPKRSFGQGNIFTGVCDSVHRGGLVPGGRVSGLGGSPIFRGKGGLQFFGGGSPPEYGQRSAGTHPTGMHSCLWKVLLCMNSEN